jgi:hypothetical protein
VEWNRGPRSKHTATAIFLLTNVPETYWRQKTASLTNGAGKTAEKTAVFFSMEKHRED